MSKFLRWLLPSMAPPPEQDELDGYVLAIPYDVCLTDGDIIEVGNVRIRRVGLNLRIMVKPVE